jgi:hypothetical protein
VNKVDFQIVIRLGTKNKTRALPFSLISFFRRIKGFPFKFFLQNKKNVLKFCQSSN